MAVGVTRNNLNAAMSRHMFAIANALGTGIVADAKAKVPVASGELQASIGYRVFQSRWVLRIQATAAHAWFVEFGTIHMRARPFIRPALATWLYPGIVAHVHIGGAVTFRGILHAVTPENLRIGRQFEKRLSRFSRSDSLRHRQDASDPGRDIT
jgi:HK97 gp10 family phage protein